MRETNPKTNQIPPSELWTLLSFSPYLHWDTWIQQKWHSQKVQLQGNIKHLKNNTNSYLNKNHNRFAEQTLFQMILKENKTLNKYTHF